MFGHKRTNITQYKPLDTLMTVSEHCSIKMMMISDNDLLCPAVLTKATIIIITVN